MTSKIPAIAKKSLLTFRFWRHNRLILREFKHFKKTTTLFFACSCLGAILEGFGLGFLLAFLQELTNPNAEPVRTGFQLLDVYVLGINGSEAERMYRISALILLTAILRAAASFGSGYFQKLAEIKLADRLRCSIFEQLQAQSLSYFSDKRSGNLINVLTTEMERVKQLVSLIGFCITRCLTLAVYFLSMLLLSWQLWIVSILLFGALAVALSTLNKRIRESSFEISRASNLFTSTAVEFINGIRTIHAFSTVDFERQRYYRSSAKISAAWRDVAKFAALVRPSAEAASILLLVGMIVFSYTFGLLEVSSLLTFFFVLFRSVPTLKEINGSIAQISSIQGSVDNIIDLLKPDDKIYFQNGYKTFKGLQDHIEFRGVGFSYNLGEPILRDVNFTIPKGTTAALVGASGAGKTTLADLIPRFYTPTEGTILFDGVDSRLFDIISLRRRMAIVSQDTFIFNASVRDNIAYGTNTPTDAQIERAAQLANAIEFIREMSDGFDTPLGDRGVRLSGGQRQRLAIARALLRNPEVLILDEATSALDSVSEQLIQQAIEKLSTGRTVITIAHRLSTIEGADQIIVLDKGKVMEIGTHSQLLSNRGAFWQYYQIQNKGQLQNV